MLLLRGSSGASQNDLHNLISSEQEPSCEDVPTPPTADDLNAEAADEPQQQQLDAAAAKGAAATSNTTSLSNGRSTNDTENTNVGPGPKLITQLHCSLLKRFYYR